MAYSSQDFRPITRVTTKTGLDALSLTVEALTTPLKSGDIINVMSITGNQWTAEIISNVDIGDTTIQLNRTAGSSGKLNNITPIPRGSMVFLRDIEMLKKANKRYLNTHIHCYMTGSNNLNDRLPNFSQWNFNVNAGSILADGNSKPNRWASQFGTFIAPTSNGTTIEKIIYNFSTNGGNGHDFTFSLWKMPTDKNGNSNQTISLIDKFDCISQNDQNYVFHREFDLSESLSAGDIIFPSIRRVNSTTSTSKKFYGDVEILTSYIP
jgi:hypothetical protein